MKKIDLIIAAFGLGVVIHAPAAAQDFYLPPIIDNVGMGNIAIGAAAQGAVQQSQKRVPDNNVRSFTADPPNALTAPAASMDFSYRYDRGRTQQNLQNFVARTPVRAGRADLEQMFAAQPTLMDDISDGVRAYGFDPHNVADAYAVWWINVWGTSQKRNIEPDAATVSAVKRQVRNAFSATPDFAKTSDAERQEYAEALLVQAALLGSAFEQMKGNPEQLEQLAEAARQGAKAGGVDLSLMTLTSNGFVPRTGADASDVTGDAEITRVSAEDEIAIMEGEESGLSPLNIALISGMGLAAAALGVTYFVRKS